jgi:hypothetical protein
VLAEDRRQQTFARRYLEQINYFPRQIQLEPLPGNRGSGEQWVRMRYAKNVEAYRSRAARAETALVVVIDADTGPMSRRIEQLHEIITEAGFYALRANEKIIHLIPKRNIETWILCLNGHNVNETDDHRHADDIESQIKPAVVEFFKWSRPHAVAPNQCVPSLSAGIDEVRKIER